MGQEEATQREVATKLLETADELMVEVAELRGWEFKREVDKGVHSADELKAYLKKKLLEEEFGEGKLEQHQWMLSDLGFLPQGMDLADTIINVLLSQVGGFYDPEMNSFFMMEQAADFGEFANRTMIAHELTHALDDQYFDLQGLMEARQDEHDAGFAIGAVVEGSATALMTRWQAMHPELLNMEEMRKVMAQQEEQNKVLLEAPLYFSTLIARYMAGMNFLIKGEPIPSLMTKAGGIGEELKIALTDVPLSSEQILHPEKYWDAEARDLPVVLADADALGGQLAELLGGEVVSQDTLGELLCGILARNPKKQLNPMLMMNSSYWTSKGSRGWGGDRVFLLGEGDGRSVVWCTWWDTEKDCEEFREAYDKYYGEQVEYGVASHGRLAVFTYGGAKERSAEVLEICKQAKAAKGDVAFSLLDSE
jgi:hypothetical protein